MWGAPAWTANFSFVPIGAALSEVQAIYQPQASILLAFSPIRVNVESYGSFRSDAPAEFSVWLPRTGRLFTTSFMKVILQDPDTQMYCLDRRDCSAWTP